MAAKQARDIEKAKKRAAKRARSEIKNLAKTGMIKDDVHKRALAHLELIMKLKEEEEAKKANGETIPEKVPKTKAELEKEEKERKKQRKIVRKERKKEKKL